MKPFGSQIVVTCRQEIELSKLLKYNMLNKNRFKNIVFLGSPYYILHDKNNLYY
jgi:hypothetical protein